MRAKVLILEDDAEIAELIGLYLGKEGIQFKAVSSAEEALDSFKEGAWDLVTVDLNLPGRDGFEFLEELRRVSRVPAVVISAREADEDKLRAFSGGADDFVGKPFNPALLAARVRAHLRRAAYGREGDGLPPDRALGLGPFILDPLSRRVRVSDDGPGIPDQDRKLIFSEFYRGSRARPSSSKSLKAASPKDAVHASFHFHLCPVSLRPRYLPRRRIA